MGTRGLCRPLGGREGGGGKHGGLARGNVSLVRNRLHPSASHLSCLPHQGVGGVGRSGFYIPDSFQTEEGESLGIQKRDGYFIKEERFQ